MDETNCTFIGVLLCTLLTSVYCRECYNCQSISSPFSCNHTITCADNQVCFTEKQGTHFTSGCTTSQQCTTKAGAASIIGRDLSNRQSADCHECCSSDFCNANLCVHLQPSACVDDETVDCAKLNSVFGICSDVQKAKLFCSKFCNLCSLVDGQWSQWTSWSVCSVTCENGTETRHRSCNSPAPANGGTDCVGSSKDTKPCVSEPCPVHGGWSLWSDWGSCSVSCDVGMQRRDRSCNNPYPARNGDHCFGDSRDDRICMSAACADGNWSQWGSWSPCSDSCGGGVKSRGRTCSNPAPSQLGKYCIGNPMETTTCNRNPCPDNRVAFTATNNVHYAGPDLIFSKVIANYGNGYNQQTGRFTCSIPGLYYFSATLTKKNSDGSDYVECFIKINSISQIGTNQNPYHTGSVNNDYDGYSLSMSGTFHLNKYDIVNIGNCKGQDGLSHDADLLSSFTGFLISPDN